MISSGGLRTNPHAKALQQILDTVLPSDDYEDNISSLALYIAVGVLSQLYCRML